MAETIVVGCKLPNGLVVEQDGYTVTLNGDITEEDILAS